MNDLEQQLANLPPSAMKDEILHYVRTTGVREALLAAVELLKDKKTPPATRSAMVTVMFKLAGFLERPSDPGDELAKLSGSELLAVVEKMDAEVARLDRETKARQRLIDQLDEPVDIFA